MRVEIRKPKEIRNHQEGSNRQATEAMKKSLTAFKVQKGDRVEECLVGYPLTCNELGIACGLGHHYIRIVKEGKKNKEGASKHAGQERGELTMAFFPNTKAITRWMTGPGAVFAPCSYAEDAHRYDKPTQVLNSTNATQAFCNTVNALLSDASCEQSASLGIERLVAPTPENYHIWSRNCIQWAREMMALCQKSKED